MRARAKSNLVKHPQIQAKLWEEMKGVVGEGEEEVKEEDLEKMPYLKAAAAHAGPLSAAAWSGGGGEIGWVCDRKGRKGVLHGSREGIEARGAGAAGGEGETIFDIKGSREKKMMPFGAGNLVWKFEWKGVVGVGVDLSEFLFSLLPTAMKNPLQARISTRT